MFRLLLYQLRLSKYINSIEYTDKGERFYYSTMALTFSLVKNVGLIIMGFYLFISIDINLYVILFCGLIITIFMLSPLTDIIPRLLYRNPIFIISDNSLICTKNDTSYDLTTSQFIKYKAHRQIIGYQIRIQRQDKTKQFNEDLFWVKDTKKLEKIICEIKGIKRLPNNMDVPADFYNLTDK